MSQANTQRNAKDKTMQATVIRINEGRVEVRVRRSSRVETLSKRYDDLKVGDKVEVTRQVNNPFLVRK
jgi:hypothetical protein